MSRKVIAVDFDDTLFTNAWPGVGEPIWPVINKAKEEQANGAAIILWTCRIGESLDNAVEACRKVGLIPDAVNETLPEWLETWVDDPRKIGANEYWDDRAVNIKDLVEGQWLCMGVSNSTGPIFKCSSCGKYHNPSTVAMELRRQQMYPSHCPHCGKRMVGTRDA